MGTTLTRWAIEAKVAASTAASAAAGIGVAILNDIEADHSLLGGTPAWLQALLLVVVPPLVTFLAGYQARHTPRPADAADPAPPAPPTQAV
jgi:hypothetical protein